MALGMGERLAAMRAKQEGGDARKKEEADRASKEAQERAAQEAQEAKRTELSKRREQTAADLSNAEKSLQESQSAVEEAAAFVKEQGDNLDPDAQAEIDMIQKEAAKAEADYEALKVELAGIDLEIVRLESGIDTQPVVEGALVDTSQSQEPSGEDGAQAPETKEVESSGVKEAVDVFNRAVETFMSDASKLVELGNNAKDLFDQMRAIYARAQVPRLKALKIDSSALTQATLQLKNLTRELTAADQSRFDAAESQFITDPELKSLDSDSPQALKAMKEMLHGSSFTFKDEALKPMLKLMADIASHPVNVEGKRLRDEEETILSEASPLSLLLNEVGDQVGAEAQKLLKSLEPVIATLRTMNKLKEANATDVRSVAGQVAERIASINHLNNDLTAISDTPARKGLKEFRNLISTIVLDQQSYQELSTAAE